jgi:hypothetical protein
MTCVAVCCSVLWQIGRLMTIWHYLLWLLWLLWVLWLFCDYCDYCEWSSLCLSVCVRVSVRVSGSICLSVCVCVCVSVHGRDMIQSVESEITSPFHSPVFFFVCFSVTSCYGVATIHTLPKFLGLFSFTILHKKTQIDRSLQQKSLNFVQQKRPKRKRDKIL